MHGASHQKHRLREEVNVKVEEILSVSVPGGKITEEGVRVNIGVALQYLSSWLSVMFVVSFFLDSLTVSYPLYTSFSSKPIQLTVHKHKFTGIFIDL